MAEPVQSAAEDLMTRPSDLLRPESPSSTKLTGKHVCPYCGAVNDRTTQPCPRCTMEDTPSTRAATKARIGPWYVLQSRNPSAPGMKWATVLALVQKGQITPRSVVRGPTTHQLWRFAAHVKGLSREFGLCYSCGEEIDKLTNQCPHCDRLQEPPINPDVLLEARDPRAPVNREIRIPPSTELATISRDRQVSGTQPDTELRADAGMLSARELAAAFQLDFQPGEVTQKPVARVTGRRFGRVVTLLLLVALVAGAAVIYVKPEYRQPTVGWIRKTGSAVGAWVRSLGDSPTPVTRKPPAAGNSGANASVDPSSTSTNEPASRKTSPPVEPAPVQPTDTQRADSPALPAGDPIETARALWSQGIDAEARNDFAEAVRCYEAIKALPQSAWPTSLELRLTSARKQAH